MAPLLFALLGGFGSFKLGQALTDEDYPGTTVPENVREEMIQHHIKWYGLVCPRCDKPVPRYELQIDHKIPIASGGRNSRYNLQVLCRPCNQSKGSSYSLFEKLLGRKS
jgi:hypothetical protein